MAEGKRGPYSVEEKEFIEFNCETLDYKDIAEHLQRDPIAIKKYIEKHLGKKVVKGQRIAKTADYNIENSHIWSEIKQEFSPPEQRTFLYHWERIVSQFKEDVLPTEELQIIDMIKLELLMGRALRQQRESHKSIEEYEKEIKKIKSLDVAEQDNIRIGQLDQLITFHRAALESLTKEHSDLLNRKMALMKELKGTRAERIKRIEDSKQTFLGWVSELLQNKKLRVQLGDYIEKMRIAIDVEKIRLMTPHKYMDGEMDCPLYTAETLEYLEKQEQK